MTGRAAARAAAIALLLAVAGTAAPGLSLEAAAATGSTARSADTVVPVIELDKRLPGRRLTGRRVLAIAERHPLVKQTKRQVERAYPGAYTKGPGRWQVSYFSRDTPPKEVAQLYVDDATGRVTEAYGGYKVAWTMARGYPGAFGRAVNTPWIWIGLTVLFLAPFARVRGVRVDLAVLAAFGISVAYFNDAQIAVSVPLVYPLLAYLGLRAGWIGLRRRDAERPRGELRLLVPASALAIATVFLLGFRVGLDVVDGNIIDVGYAGVIGADKLLAGEPLYGSFPRDNEHGDTYGPVTYAAYLPGVAALGWSGRWDSEMPAARATAIAFDLLCCALLFLIGRRLRGPTLGVVLAYLWAAFPFTLYVLASNSNDSLVAALVLLALYAASSAPARGAAVALGGLTKFATLALAPLFATHGWRRTRTRGLTAFCLSFAVVAALVMAPVVLRGEALSTVYDRTVGFQASRSSPFSLWGLYGLPALQQAWQVLSVALALAAALVPRRRDVVGLSACAAAVVIALQAGVTHWFYLYVVWFFPLLIIALFARYEEPGAPPEVSAPRAAALPSQATSSGSIAVA